MTDLSSEIREAIEKKIAMHQREIDKLREGMNVVLSALQDNEGKREGVTSRNDSPPSGQRVIRFANKQHGDIIRTVYAGADNTRTRISRAVDKMPPSGFGTHELLAAVNSDGNPNPVNKGRALRIFNDMIKAGEIKVLVQRSGNKGGTYAKNVAETTTDTSLVSSSGLLPLAEEKGGDTP